MVHNTQVYWVFGLCLSSDIPKERKNTTFRTLDLFPSLVYETLHSFVFLEYQITDKVQKPSTSKHLIC
jgi:hypothetical protein